VHAIAFGERLFGKVDRVPGKYHVATLCWHFCYLPLVPLGTFLVLQERMVGMTTRFEGIRIPFSPKSLLIAWTRSILAFPFGALLFSLAVVLFAADQVNMKSYWLAVAVEGLVALLLFGPYVIPGVGRATARRADVLAGWAGRTVVNGRAASSHL
jgi:hypothetical protein